MKKLYKQIAVVGRFTIVHLGHEALFNAAVSRLEEGGLLTVLIGSAGHYPSPKHPVSFEKRADMVFLSDIKGLKEKKIRLEAKPVYDFYIHRKHGLCKYSDTCNQAVRYWAVRSLTAALTG